MAAFNSFGSIVPDPSVSNRLKASRISSISSSESPGLSMGLAPRRPGVRRDCHETGDGGNWWGGGGRGQRELSFFTQRLRLGRRAHMSARGMEGRLICTGPHGPVTGSPGKDRREVCASISEKT